MYKDIISMLLALAGIVCVILFTYFAGRWYAKKMGAVSAGKHIRVVDRIMVGKNGAIMIIDVDGSQYLVGANENSMAIMKELENTIELPDTGMAAGNKFKEYFAEYLYKGKKND